MKLTLLILTIFCIHVSGRGYAQQISLSEKNSSLSKVFSSIKKQSGYSFFYKGTTVKGTKVSVQINNATVEQALNAVLRDQLLTYSIIDKTIIIIKKNSITVKDNIGVVNAPVVLKGKVIDNNGKPLPGVTVRLKGVTNIVTVTDNTGNYTITLPDNTGTLVFSFVGFVTQEISVTQRTVIDVQLFENQTDLSQVVVVGYGTQKKIDLSGAVSSIHYDNTLEDRPITNLSQAIEGNASGINISQAGGQPGHDGSTIRIRGVGTLNNADPLILVDGIVGSLNNLNPNDVADISILKDAASAAIYGSRAANGVILVTTKMGKSGKTVVNYNTYYGLQDATNLFKTVSNYADYMVLMNRIQKSDNPAAADLFQPATIAAWQNATDRTLFPNTDWMKVIFKQGTLTKNNISVSGGDNKTTFFLSGAYTNNIGVMRATDDKEYSFRFNLEHKISNKFKVGTNTSLEWRQINQPGDVTTLIYYGSNATPGTTPSLVVDGEKRYGGRNTADESNEVVNLLQYTDTWFHPIRQQFVFSKLYAEYDILKDLKFSVNGGVNYYNDQTKDYILNGPIMNEWNFQTMQLAQNNTATPSTLTQNNDDALGLTFYSTLNYKKDLFTDHHFNVLLGTSSEWNKSTAFTGAATGFPGNNTFELSAALGTPKVTGSSSSYSLESYFGRLNYDYKGKYLFAASIRDDGSSRFAAGRRYGVFPSFSAAWILSEEPFFKAASLPALSSIKFRASYGKLGNQNIGLYQYMSLYGIGQNYIFGNTLSSGIAPTALSNPDITWETTTSTNLGADLSFFNNQLNLTVEVYNNKTSNILVQLPLASVYGGLTVPYQNVGIVQNKGWELQASYKNTFKGISYGINGNLTQVANKVLQFQGNPNVTQSLGNNLIIQQGQSIGSIYGYQAIGIFQSQAQIAVSPKQKPSGTNTPGDLIYKDQNGDGVINATDRVIIGNSIAKYNYGFGGNIGYKGVNLYVLFQGISGVDRYYNNLWYTSGVRYRRAINAVFANAWTPTNTDTTVPRLTTDANTDNTVASSYWVQNGAYLRLKNVQLSYTIPQNWIKKTFISKLQMYVNGQNLLTSTKFNGLDPETATPTNYQVEYPNVRIISFGLNASF